MLLFGSIFSDICSSSSAQSQHKNFNKKKRKTNPPQNSDFLSTKPGHSETEKLLSQAHGGQPTALNFWCEGRISLSV